MRNRKNYDDTLDRLVEQLDGMNVDCWKAVSIMNQKSYALRDVHVLISKLAHDLAIARAEAMLAKLQLVGEAPQAQPENRTSDYYEK